MASNNNKKNKMTSRPAAGKKSVGRPAMRTPVRNSAVPRISAASTSPAAVKSRPQITHEQISRRAYEIHLSGTGGSEFENWIRAERELRGQ
jgi:hypothetical protein